MSEWIKSNEHVPDNKEPVLGFISGFNDMVVLYYDGKVWRNVQTNYRESPSHWQELPIAPQL